MLEYIRRLFAYDDWANGEALRSLQAAGTPPPRSVKIMAHILAAEHVWLGRLKGDRTAVEVWPGSDLDQSDQQRAKLRAHWRAYLNVLTPEDLSRPVAYVNTLGDACTSTIQDILMHIVMHSAYHRGQIATGLGGAGHKAAYTDFIHSVRRGFIE